MPFRGEVLLETSKRRRRTRKTVILLNNSPCRSVILQRKVLKSQSSHVDFVLSSTYRVVGTSSTARKASPGHLLGPVGLGWS